MRAADAETLLVVCALSVERLALWSGGSGTATVVRTGMGPHAARRVVSRALSGEAVPGRRPVAVTGFCAGLVPGMRPGDLVLAEETAAGGRHTRCTDTAPLAKALRGRGTLHSGVLAGAARLVRPSERAALRSEGAIAVDMESAAALGAAVAGAGDRPVTAVRVVVDAPGHELLRFGTLIGGASAFRVLRTVLPALHEWHHSLLLPRR